jgi:hypothetical protein
MSELFAVLRRGPARPLETGEWIWHLPPLPTLRTREEKWDCGLVRLAIASAIIRSGLPTFLWMLEEPDPAMADHVVGPASWGWRLKQPRPVLEFLFNEHMGGDWFVWVSERDFDGPHPNAFRTDPVVLAQLMRQSGLVYFIESFHDDAEWIIGVNVDLVPHLSSR